MPTTKTSSKRFSSEKRGRVPLERALSKLGLLSRSQARRSILAGEVRVDGRVVLDPFSRVVPETIRVEIQGRSHPAAEPKMFLYHKPKRTVCTRSDEKGRRTIFEDFKGFEGHYHSVGRLDYNTTGLLLITNHSRWSDFLTDPKNAIPREYHATVEGEITQATIAEILAGVVVDGVAYNVRAARLRKASRKESHLFVTLSEGKNREVRNLLSAVGHPVRALKRLSFGPFALGDLAPGHFREAQPLGLGELPSVAL